MIYNYRNKLVPLLQPGIYGIINNRNKTIYIGFSGNMLQSIVPHLTQIRDRVHPCIPSNSKVKNLQLIVIETCSEDLLRVRHGYWIEHYRNTGYTVYNKKDGLKYKVRIVVDKEFNVLVQLVSKRYDYTTIGVFNKVQEAQEFVDKVKLNNPIIPIYADNEQTKLYLSQSVNK